MRTRFFVIIVGTIIVVLGISAVWLKLYHHFNRPSQPVVEKVEDKKITIIEGWSNQDIQTYLEKQLGITKEQFIAAQKDFSATDFPFLVSKPASIDLEGYLFPDTYLVAPNSDADTVLAKLLDNFEIKFNKALSGKTADSHGRYIIPGYESLTIGGQKGLSLNELLTLASIVEKETGRDVSAGSSDTKARLDEERKTVAGIFYNRLNIGQALQSDATVNYATGKNQASASAQDIEVNSPYNTYKHAGLPPGPISNPSLSSLIAVLQPIKTNYFYFLHKQPSGEVVYSKTFEEHSRNKALYLK